MGLAAALFSLGTSTLVATVVPVSDEETVDVMLELHRRLQAGAGPAEALAHAQRDGRGAGFVCFGNGA